jgi:hypothetical protein
MHYQVVIKLLALVAHTSFVVYLLFFVMWDKSCTIGSIQMAEDFVDNQVWKLDDIPLYAMPITDAMDGTSYVRDSPSLQEATVYNPDPRCATEESVSDALNCVDTGLFAFVRYALPKSTSLVLASSLNLFYIILVFEWISTSFAVFYLMNPHDTLNTKRVLVVWNLILMLATVTLSSTSEWNIPANNVMVGLVSLAVTIFVQMFVDRIAPAVDRKSDDKSRQQDESVSGHYSIIIRYCEYAITAPLLMMGTIAVCTTYAPIWALQVAFVGTMLCNVMGIFAHAIFDANPVAAGIFQQAAWFYFASAWTFFIHVVTSLSPDTPSFVISLLLLLPIFYSCFGIAGSTLHAYLRYRELVPANVIDQAHYRDAAFRITGTIFDLLSVVVKLAISLTVVTGGSFGPGSNCDR